MPTFLAIGVGIHLSSLRDAEGSDLAIPLLLHCNVTPELPHQPKEISIEVELWHIVC